MLPLTVCRKSSKCCVSASGVVAENDDHEAPTRVFIGVARTCNESDPPISSPTGSPAGGWVEAALITSIGNGDYLVSFPGFSATDPRCVTPCNANYNVCLWVYYADGTHQCFDTNNFNPETHCTEQSPGCPDCETDEM